MGVRKGTEKGGFHPNTGHVSRVNNHTRHWRGAG